MEASAIHRLIERHAAMRPEAIAIVDRDSTITYRDLNVRANAVARSLMANGLRRGGHAIVNMERSAELGVVLLAVLKAGASYEWTEPIEATTCGRNITVRPRDFADGLSVDSPSSWSVSVDDVLTTTPQPTPNLPILTRGSDIACVLRSPGHAACVLLPHATVVALRPERLPAPNAWRGEQAALDLLVPLMTGGTAVTVPQFAGAAPTTECAA